MKQPNLSYNYYFPFYTQIITGKKRYYYRIETVIHLSENKGIRIERYLESNKIRNIVIEYTDKKILNKHISNDIFLSYKDFAKEMKTVYNAFYKSLRELKMENAYIKHFLFTSYFKFNQSIELEFYYSKMELIFGNFEYKIVDGKIINMKNKIIYSDSEDDSILKKLDGFVDVVNNNTSFKIIGNDEFKDGINVIWERFIPYFEAPKFIRKKEYEI